MTKFLEKLKKGMGIEEEKEEKESEEKMEEGELSIDLLQTEKEFILLAPIAGIKGEEIEIEVEDNILKIEGERKKPLTETGEFLIKECYWGKFKRELILPEEINLAEVEASLKNGVLIIRLPKAPKEKKKKIEVKEE